MHHLAFKLNLGILDKRMHIFLTLTLLLPMLWGRSDKAQFQVVRVIWTSDLHSVVLPTPDFAAAGLPRRHLGGWHGLMRLIKEVRQPGSLLLDNGDFGFGSPEGDSSQGRLAVWLMNRLGYDGAVLGARDFTGGLQNLELLARYATFPILGDPMLDVLLNRSSPLFRPYFVKEVNGVRIGIIGITDPEITIYNRKTDVAGLVIDEPVKQVARYLPAVKAESVELVVVLGHIDAGVARQIVESVPGIDLIICRGETDKVESQLPKSGQGVVVVAGVYGQRVGVVDILFHKTERRVYAIEAQVMNVEPDLEKDSAVEQAVLSGMDCVVVENEEEFFPNGAGKAKLGLLVAEAVRQITGADLVVLPFWVIEQGLEKGKLSRRQLYNAVPYKERLRIVSLPESLLAVVLTPIEIDPGFPAPFVAGADLFVRGDTLNAARIGDVVQFRLRDRRKGVYRVATTETWLERTGLKEKGRVFPENLTAVWLRFAEQAGRLNPVLGPKLYAATPKLAPKTGSSGLIDINSATVEMLCELPGIGPKTAQRIVEYREQYGKFKSVEEIMNVRGIGPKKYEQIKDLITVR